MNKAFFYKTIFVWLLGCCVLLGVSNPLFAQATFVPGGANNWNNTARWSTGAIPTAATTVTIPVGATCNVDVAAVCSSITYTIGNGSSTISINAGQSLTVTNAININGPNGGINSNTLAVGSGTVTCGSITVLTEGTNGNRDSDITISTGTLNVTGNLTMSATANRSDIVFTGGGTINVGGNGTPCFQTGSLTTFANSTINYNRAGNQEVSVQGTDFGGSNYENLTVSGSGTKTLRGNTNVNGNLAINGTSVLDPANNDLTVTGTTNIAATATFNDTNNGSTNIFIGAVTNAGTWTSTAVTTTTNLIFRNGITNSGTFNAGAARFNTNNQALAGGGAMNFANAVDVTGVILTNNNTNTITITGVLDGTGTWTQGGVGSTLSINNATQPMATGTLNAATCANTVNYSLAGNQNIKGGNYCNLTTSGTGTKTVQGAITVNGNLSVQLNTTFQMNGQNITVNGTSNIAGTATTNADNASNNFVGLVTISGTWDNTAQNTAGWTYFRGGITNTGTANMGIIDFITNNQTITGTFNYADDVYIEGTITTNFVNATNIVAGTIWYTNWSGAAVVNFNSTLTINGELRVSNTGTHTFTGNVTVNGTGNWNGVGNPNMSFGGSAAFNSPNFTAGTGIYNLTNTGGTATFGSTYIGGSGTPFIPAITNLTLAANAIYDVSFPVRLDVTNLIVNAAATLRNVNRIDVATAITGTGTILQQNNSNLRIGGTIAATVNLQAATNANIVEYFANANQTVRAVNYYSLSLTSTSANTTNIKSLATGAATIRTTGFLYINQATFAVNTAGGGSFVPSSVTENPYSRFTYTPVVTTTAAFNTANPYNGQFDEISALSSALPNYNGNYVISQGGQDLAFVRGDNGGGAGLFAAKTTDFAVAPTTAIIKFNIAAKSFFNDNNVATLYIGTGTGANATVDGTVKAQIQFNMVAGGNNDQFQVVYPDAGGFTSATQTGTQQVMMIVNTSGAAFGYTDPCNAANTVANNRVDIWVGGTQLVNDQTMASAGTAFTDIKFVYNAGTINGTLAVQPTLYLSNLTIQNANPATTNLSGQVNRYAAVTAINVATRTMTVDNPTCFNVGDLVMIMQMKGATITNTNTAAYGTITGYNNAGRYEARTISAIAGNNITFSTTFSFPFDATKSVQLIKIANVTGNVTLDGTIMPQAWDGTKGGVVVIFASGTMTFNADINAAGMGFRGGNVSTNFAGGSIGVDCSEGSYVQNDVRWGQKGEGVVAVADAGVGIYARGRLANGGGGGNPHNSGGGGGSNFGTGANGGRQWNCIGGDAENGCNVGNQNGDPTATALNNGVGGTGLDYTVDASNRVRLFMGGGGGGGQQNNDFATEGMAGGGIVILRTTNIIGNNRTIFVNGASQLVLAGNDSGGGGGAGGTVFFDSPTYTGNLTVNARGGKGGDVNFASCHGNGGGGGGGIVIFAAPQPPNVAISNGGGPSSRNIDGADCSNLANPFFCTTPAGAGGQIIAGNNIVLLPVNLLSFTAEKDHKKVNLKWITTSEKDNAYFEVQRSTDGENFVSIGMVKGNGTTNTKQTYTDTDYYPNSGINYYRLKQIDIDGSIRYSKIISLVFDEAVVFEVVIYPNPTPTNQLNIRLAENLGEIKVEVADLLGRTIASTLKQNSPQEYTLTLQNSKSTGTYLIRVLTEQGQVIKKLVVE